MFNNILRDRNVVLISLLVVFFLLFRKSFNINSTVVTIFFASVAIVVITLSYWKVSLYFFFISFIIEGIIRKWVLPEYSNIIFIIKYLFLISPILYFINKKIPINKKYYPFLPLLLIYSLFIFLQILNPSVNMDMRVKVLGIMIYLAFIPLIFIMPYFITSKNVIKNFMFYIALFSIPLFILGIFQFYSPADSFINKYVAQEAHVATFGEFARITGTFSYISPYTSYVTFTTVVLLCLLLIGNLKIYQYIVIMVSLPLCILNLIMTGSRGALVVVIFTSVIFIIFSLNSIIKRNKAFLLILLCITGSIYFTFSYTTVGQKSLNAFMTRMNNTLDVRGRIIDNYTPFKYMDQSGLVGFGIATTYGGAARFIGDRKDMPTGYEEEWERVLIETGIIGFSLLIILRLSIFIYVLKAFFKARDPEIKIYLLFIILYQLPVILGFRVIVFNYLENMLYWFSVGLFVSIKLLMDRQYEQNYRVSSRYTAHISPG